MKHILRRSSSLVALMMALLMLSGCFSSEPTTKAALCETFDALGKELLTTHILSDNAVFRRAGDLADAAGQYEASPAVKSEAKRIRKIADSDSTSAGELLNATQAVADVCGHPLGIGGSSPSASGTANSSASGSTPAVPSSLTERLAEFDKLPFAQPNDSLRDPRGTIASRIVLRWSKIASETTAYPDSRYLWGIVEDPNSQLGQKIASSRLYEDFTSLPEEERGNLDSLATERTIPNIEIASRSLTGPLTLHVKFEQDHWLVLGLQDGGTVYGTMAAPATAAATNDARLRKNASLKDVVASLEELRVNAIRTGDPGALDRYYGSPDSDGHREDAGKAQSLDPSYRQTITNLKAVKDETQDMSWVVNFDTEDGHVRLADVVWYGGSGNDDPGHWYVGGRYTTD